tara:strand:- start:969 stop:2102 length:1134 start_codon:yes stop_codon:yes gene_type:complete
MRYIYLFLAFFSVQAYSVDLSTLRVFQETSFEEIELQISEFSQPKDPPIRGQWMKKDEYDLILKEFYENQQRDTIIYAVPIELNTCGYWDDLDQYANQKGIVGDPLHPSCYDVDDEVIYLNAPNTLNTNFISLERSFLKEKISKIEKREVKDGNRFKNIDVNVSTSIFDRLSVNNTDNTFHTLKVDFDFETVKNTFDAFNLWGLIKIKLSYSNLSSDKKIDQYASIKYPTEVVTQQDTLTADFHGYLLTYGGQTLQTIIKSQADDEMLVEEYLPDEDYLPLFKVQPAYPRRAQERGINGYSIVSFDINEDGSVDNIKVVEGMCGPIGSSESNYRSCNTFDESSIRAAEKMKYKPRLVKGKAVKVEGVLQKFTFEISS